MSKAKQICKRFQLSTRRVVLSALIAVIALAGSSLLMVKSSAANPTNGTLTSTGPNVTWRGTKIGPAAPNGEADCADPILGPNVCDVFILTLPEGFAANQRARIQINWLSPTTDYDMYVHAGSENGATVGQSATGTTTFEQVDIDPATLTGANRVLYVRVVYFAAVGGIGGTGPEQYSGVASVREVPAAFEPPASTCSTFSYENFKPPCTDPNNYVACETAFPGYNSAGEPSLGVNWNTGNVLFISNINFLRATFNDTQTSPASVIWARRDIANQAESLDPIMFTDPTTGRSIPGQLLAALGTSATAITDDDGESFLPNLTTGITSGVDHQTIGAGPYKRGVLLDPNNPTGGVIGPTTAYPNAWYYASQSIGAATATRSDNGGLTYGPAVAMYNLTQCNGLHGHVKVAPDGTVYVPNKNCPGVNGGGQGFAVSDDNGVSWRVKVLANSGTGDNDPAVAIGAGGRVYFAYTSSNKTIRAAVTDDKGETFMFDQNIGNGVEIAPGSMGNITASVFPAAVAGDNNRAAIFFLGTGSTDPNDATGTDGAPAAGADTNTADDFKGTWYPYIATTCNGGRSWTTTRAGDAVQQGVVCTNGTTCPSGTRNLLDFNDLQVDAQGRVLAGYADGCVSGTCVGKTPNSVSRLGNDRIGTRAAQVATIIRQTGGFRLFADFDLGGPRAPQLPPPVEIESTQKGNDLKWGLPDDAGSPLTSYRIYRGEGEKSPRLIAQVSANVRSFVDRTSQVGRLPRGVYYQVTAVNSYGESPRTLKFYVR